MPFDDSRSSLRDPGPHPTTDRCVTPTSYPRNLLKRLPKRFPLVKRLVVKRFPLGRKRLLSGRKPLLPPNVCWLDWASVLDWLLLPKKPLLLTLEAKAVLVLEPEPLTEPCRPGQGEERGRGQRLWPDTDRLVLIELSPLYQ